MHVNVQVGLTILALKVISYHVRYAHCLSRETCLSKEPVELNKSKHPFLDMSTWGAYHLLSAHRGAPNTLLDL